MAQRFLPSALLAMAACAAATGGAMAHPHVFAEARLEVVVGDDGMVDRLQHIWRFDELFSSTVMLEFDADGSDALEQEELDKVGSVITQSIAEFDYFQTIQANGADIGVKPVEDMKVIFEDGQMIVFFTAYPAQPVDIASSPSFGVYDPTFYTAIEYMDDDQMVLEGAPVGCTEKMVVPDPDEAIAQNADQLTQAFYDESATNDMSKLLATRMEVSCQ